MIWRRTADQLARPDLIVPNLPTGYAATGDYDRRMCTDQRRRRHHLLVADLRRRRVDRSAQATFHGLHALDLTLVAGDIDRLLTAQTNAWHS